MRTHERRGNDGSDVRGVRTPALWKLLVGACVLFVAPMVPAVVDALTVNVCSGTPTGPNCAGTSHLSGSPVITGSTLASVSLQGKTFGGTIPGTSTPFTVSVATCTSLQDAQCTGVATTNPARVVITDGAASGGFLVDSVDLVNAVISVSATGIATDAIIAPVTFTIQYESGCGQFGSLLGGSYPIAADIDMKTTRNNGTTSLGITGSTDGSVIKLTNRVNICPAGAPGTIVNVTAPTAAPSVVCDATTANPYSSPLTGRCTKSEIQGQQGTNTFPVLCGTTGVASSCVPAFRQDLAMTCKRAGCKFTIPKSTAGTFGPKRGAETGGFGDVLSVVGNGPQLFQWPTTDLVNVNWLSPLPDKQGQGAQDTPFHWNFAFTTGSTPSSLLLVSKPSDNGAAVIPGAVAQTNDSGYAGVTILPVGLVQFGQLTNASAVWRYKPGGDCAKSLFFAFTVLHEGFPKEVFFDYGQVFDAALESPNLSSTGGYKNCLTSPTGGGEPNDNGQTSTVPLNIFSVNDKKWDASQVDPSLAQASLAQVRSAIRRDFVTQAKVVLFARDDDQDATLELFKVTVNAGSNFKFTTPGQLGFTTATGSQTLDCVRRDQVTLRIVKTGPPGAPHLGESAEFVQGDAKGEIQFNAQNCRYDLAASNDPVQAMGPGNYEAQPLIGGFPIFPTIPFVSGAQ